MVIPDYATNNAHMFYIICESKNQRSAIINHLMANDILAVFHYISLHTSPYYKSKYNGNALTNSDKFTSRLLRLPMFYELDVEQVVSKLLSMNRIWKIIGHPNLLKILSVIALVVYALLLIVNTPNKFVFHNNDNYKGTFLRFLELGYYDAVSEGTTILYNVFLNGLFTFTNNIETSFVILNALSQLFLIIFGFYFLKKQVKKINIHFVVLFGLYLLFTINLKSFAAASNDAFLGVFVIVLLYLLIQKLFDAKNQYLTFSLIGFILALCFSIRMTAILLIPLIAFAFIIWFINSNEDCISENIKNISIHFNIYCIHKYNSLSFAKRK